MKAILKSLGYLISSSILAINAPAIAKEPEGYVTKNNCDYINFMIAPNGECIDLTYLTDPQSSPTNPQQSTLVSRFKLALQKLDISIQYIACPSKPGTVLFGYYETGSNTLVICPAARKNGQQMIETLVHESWHAVQDCMDGLENGEIVALSEIYPDVFRQILGSTSLDDFNDVISLYGSEDHKNELEARYMEDKPELVLKGLAGCKAKK